MAYRIRPNPLNMKFVYHGLDQTVKSGLGTKGVPD